MPMGILTGKVCMRVHVRACPLAFAVPGTMNIIRHEVEVVNVGLHSCDIEAFEVPWGPVSLNGVQQTYYTNLA